MAQTNRPDRDPTAQGLLAAGTHESSTTEPIIDFIIAHAWAKCSECHRAKKRDVRTGARRDLLQSRLARTAPGRGFTSHSGADQHVRKRTHRFAQASREAPQPRDQRLLGSRVNVKGHLRHGGGSERETQNIEGSDSDTTSLSERDITGVTHELRGDRFGSGLDGVYRGVRDDGDHLTENPFGA